MGMLGCLFLKIENMENIISMLFENYYCSLNSMFYVFFVFFIIKKKIKHIRRIIFETLHREKSSTLLSIQHSIYKIFILKYIYIILFPLSIFPFKNQKQVLFIYLLMFIKKKNSKFLCLLLSFFFFFFSCCFPHGIVYPSYMRGRPQKHITLHE